MNGEHEAFIKNLITRKEVAETCKVPISTVNGWVEHRDSNRFPLPIKPTVRGSTAYYWKPDVEEWFKSYSMTRRRYGTRTN